MKRFFRWLKSIFTKKELVVTPVNIPHPEETKKIYEGNPPSDIDKPEWEVVSIDPKGIIVSWQEKYGALVTQECIGLWYSAKRQEYMLTWKDDRKVYIQKSNCNDIKVRKKETL